MNMKKILSSTSALLLAFSLTACASASKDIEASYVSSSKYGGKSCSSLEREFIEINGQVIKQSKKQDKKAEGDAVATGIGAVLFWPALFFIKGDSANADSLAGLKGEYEAVKRAAEKRRCSFIKSV